MLFLVLFLVFLVKLRSESKRLPFEETTLAVEALSLVLEPTGSVYSRATLGLLPGLLPAVLASH